MLPKLKIWLLVSFLVVLNFIFQSILKIDNYSLNRSSDNIFVFHEFSWMESQKSLVLKNKRRSNDFGLEINDTHCPDYNLQNVPIHS